MDFRLIFLSNLGKPFVGNPETVLDSFSSQPRNSIIGLFPVFNVQYWFIRIELRKLFFCTNNFFSCLLISKNCVEMNLRIITKSHAAESEKRFPRKIDFEVVRPHNDHAPASELKFKMIWSDMPVSSPSPNEDHSKILHLKGSKNIV